MARDMFPAGVLNERDSAARYGRDAAQPVSRDFGASVPGDDSGIKPSHLILSSDESSLGSHELGRCDRGRGSGRANH
jgi:hypothetical protein